MTATPQAGAVMLPLSSMVKGNNPRRYFDRAKHDDLVGSIRLRGLLQPILLRPAPGTADLFEIVAGERRYRAALEVYGIDGKAPVVIREMTDEEALEAAIDENDVRDDASETEQADAAARRLAACGGDRAEAARRLGWSRAKLDRRLALATLSDTVKCALDERRIKVGHAELLAAIPSDKQERALDTIIGSGLDVGKTRDLLMRVTQDLGAACFDKTECTTCPFNAATQRTLFEIHVDDGHCTNAGCYQLKTQTAEAIRFEELQRAEKAAQTTAPPDDDGVDDDEHDDTSDEATDTTEDRQVDPAESGVGKEAGAPSLVAPATLPGNASAAHKPTITAQSIAGRTRDLREASWRTALARKLAGNPGHARTAILVAAMSGTLSQIKADTLKGRAGLLVSTGFPNLDYGAQIAEVRALGDHQAATVLSAIGAAYAKDVLSFGHVADLARAFDVDLRDSWRVDQAFLRAYVKDELKLVAQECGLVAHMGEKAFAKLFGGKKTDLVAGMLNATGFDWAGRLPSAMTLDGRYSPPPADAVRDDEAATMRRAA